MNLLESLGRKESEFRSWMRAMMHRRRLEAEMETELENHLEALMGDLIRAGYSPQDAARRARIAVGPALMHKEGMRASLGLRWFDELRAEWESQVGRDRIGDLQDALLRLLGPDDATLQRWAGAEEHP